jgi:hypothetical protein
MGTTYALLIQEDVAQLHAAEKAARDKSRTDRVRLLRFVKEGRVPGIAQAAAALGYSARTAERWWRLYCEGGLAALGLGAKQVLQVECPRSAGRYVWTLSNWSGYSAPSP